MSESELELSTPDVQASCVDHSTFPRYWLIYSELGGTSQDIFWVILSRREVRAAKIR